MTQELAPLAPAVRPMPPPPPPPPPPPAVRPAMVDYYARGSATAATATTPAAPEAGPSAQIVGATGVSFKLFGIPTRINLSFLLVGFVLMYGSERSLGTIAMWIGLTTIALLIHELGHALAYKSIGMEAEIALLGILGITCSPSEKKPSHGEEIYVAAAGPLAGLLVAALCYVVGDSTGGFGHGSWLHVLFILSLFLNLANLLPAFPLDGGRILKSVLEIAAPTWGASAAHVVSLFVAGAALWWTMNNEMELTALMLLGIAGANFTLLKAKEAPSPQTA